MKIPIKTGIHNEFTVVVRDTETKEVKQIAKAYNIVLNNLLTAISNRSANSMSYIAVGSGTGTLSESRTSLFAEEIRKSTTKMVSVPNSVDYENGIASQTVSMVVLSSEEVGTTFTEVGLGVSSAAGTVYTHAMLEDSEGNPISIGPKTDTEEITFYATVYLTFETPSWLDWIGSIPASSPVSNPACPMLNNIIGNAIFKASDIGTPYIFLGTGRRPQAIVNNDFTIYRADRFLVNGLATNSAGVAGEILKTIRFDSSVGNGEITEIGACGNSSDEDYYPAIRVRVEDLPSDIWNGVQKTDENIGSGDGSKIGFNLPWSRVNDLIVKIDGVTQTDGTDYSALVYPKNKTIAAQDFPTAAISVTGEGNVTGTLSNIFNGTLGDYISMFDGSDVIIDLEESKRWGFSSIGLHASSSSYRLTSGHIDVSNDGVNWTRVATGKSAPNAGWNTIAFDSSPRTSYRYVKITCADAYSNTIGFRLTEVNFVCGLDQIEFSSPPTNGAVVKASYHVPYIPKDNTKLLDIGFSFQFSRPT